MQTKNILRVRSSLLEQSVTNQLFCGVTQASGEGLASVVRRLCRQLMAGYYPQFSICFS
jgi:hypothetical protein